MKSKEPRVEIHTGVLPNSHIWTTERHEQTLKERFQEQQDVRYVYKNSDFIGIKMVDYEFLGIGQVKAICVYYAEREALATDTSNDGLGFKIPQYLVDGYQYFYPDDIDTAISCFVQRIASKKPQRKYGFDVLLDHIRVRQEKALSFTDVTLYLETTLALFWKRVYQKEISKITAVTMIDNNLSILRHFRTLWESNGLDYNRAALVYMLTVPLWHVAHREQVPAEQWVIKSYSAYVKPIADVEQEILLQTYGVQVDSI